MGKIKVRSGRGTGTVEVDDGGKKWSGDEYRKIQAEKKQKSANRTIHTGRGTGLKRLGDIPEIKARSSTDGNKRITEIGTCSRKS